MTFLTKMMAPLGALALLLMMSPHARAESVDDLVLINGISNRNLIVKGQVLHIPGQEDYVVVAGDTLTKISAKLPASSVPPEMPPAGVTPTSVDQAPPPAVTPPLPVSAPPAPAPVHQSVNWDAVAACESGGNWAINTGNGYSGGLQWAPGTWRSNKAPGDPVNASAASREQQIAAAERLYARAGTSPWPVCGKRA